MTQKHFPELNQDKLVLRAQANDKTIEPIEISYQDTLKLNQNAKLLIPTYNNDKLYYTPTFVLPIDQNFYTHNQAYLRIQFQEKIEGQLQPITKNRYNRRIGGFKLACPHTKYCQICCQKYQNYECHIGLVKHVEASQCNSFNQKIKQLCHIFYKKQKQISGKIKKKNIRKSRQGKANANKYMFLDIKDDTTENLKRLIWNTLGSDTNESGHQNSQ